MKNILYRSIFLSLCVFVNAQDSKPINLEAYSGNSSILLTWEIPEEINVKSIRLFRMQNSFTNHSLIYETSNSIERFLDKEVEGKRPYFYNIEIESLSGEIFSSIMDAPPFGKAYIDNNLFPVLSKDEYEIVENKYSDIEEFNDQVLKYILSNFKVMFDQVINYILHHLMAFLLNLKSQDVQAELIRSYTYAWV